MWQAFPSRPRIKHSLVSDYYASYSIVILAIAVWIHRAKRCIFGFRATLVPSKMFRVNFVILLLTKKLVMPYYRIEEFPGRYVWTKDDGKQYLLPPGMKNPPQPDYPPQHMDDDSDFEVDVPLIDHEDVERRLKRATHNYGVSCWRKKYIMWWSSFGCSSRRNERHKYETICQKAIASGQDPPASPFPRTPTREQLELEAKSRYWTGDPNVFYPNISRAEEYPGWFVYQHERFPNAYFLLLPPGCCSEYDLDRCLISDLSG